jgi:hypothetical protein
MVERKIAISTWKKGAVENGAKLVGIWDDFRRPFFDAGVAPIEGSVPRFVTFFDFEPSQRVVFL